MNVTEAIYARRAVRSYTPQKVDEATVRSLLRAAVQAPSAMNLQPWVFGVVQDAARLARWSEHAKALLLAQVERSPKTSHYATLLREPSFNIFYDASTLVVIGAKDPGIYTEADCWLAAENLMLAACEAGLGTCCIGFALPLLNTPDAKAELGLPSKGIAVAAIIVGHPAVAPPPVPRAEPQVLSWLK
jgi:nitroreductase